MSERVSLYARISTARQEQEQTIASQIEALERAASAQKVHVPLERRYVMSPRNVQHEYLLRGLVACGECGRRMSANAQHDYFCYTCPADAPEDRGQRPRCSAHSVRRDDLDTVVWEAIVAWLQRPEMLRHEVDAWRSSQQGRAERARDRLRLEKTQRQLSGQIERLVDAYVAGALTTVELKTRRERLEAVLQTTRARIEELAAQDQDQARLERLGESLEAFAATLRVGLDKLDFQGRRQLVCLLLERVIVTGDHIAIEHFMPLEQLDVVLDAQLPQDAADLTPQIAEDRAFPVLRHDHHRVPAVPSDVRQALPLSHDGLLSRERPGSRVGDRRFVHDGTAEPRQVTPPKAVASHSSERGRTS